jgi:hypothetical protein
MSTTTDLLKSLGKVSLEVFYQHFISSPSAVHQQFISTSSAAHQRLIGSSSALCHQNLFNSGKRVSCSIIA